MKTLREFLEEKWFQRKQENPRDEDSGQEPHKIAQGWVKSNPKLKGFRPSGLGWRGGKIFLEVSNGKQTKEFVLIVRGGKVVSYESV